MMPDSLLKDVRVDLIPLFTYSDGRRYYGVKVTHVPSGLWGFCAESKSQVVNKERAIERLARSLALQDEMNVEVITDGFTEWSITCPSCKQKSMQVVRVGKVQCWNCG